MSRLLYIDCISGVAGDMLLAALVAAGADADGVQEGLARLPLDGLRLDVGRVERHGIAASTATIRGGGEHAHRTWRDIREILASADLPAGARARAEATFERLATAEGHVHGIDPDEVHFHEVGAIDAIGEICGVALAVESLAVDEVSCSPLPLGRGFVDAAHGRLPLPAPATLELLRGAPVQAADVQAELVTPTGAALVSALASSWGGFPTMRPNAIGYGAGSRDLRERPNVLRVVVGHGEAAAVSDVVLLEANLDDMSPELVPDAAAALFNAGALDVWTTPVLMKKGRPGIVLSALVRHHSEEAVAETIFRTTSTFGVRRSALGRRELERGWRSVDVRGETVRVKVGLLGGEMLQAAPEHDDCARAAASSGSTVKAVWEEAVALARHVS